MKSLSIPTVPVLFLIALVACNAPSVPGLLSGVVSQRFDAATLEENGYLSVLDYGADPTGSVVSTQAFRDALAAGDSEQLAVLAGVHQEP